MRLASLLLAGCVAHNAITQPERPTPSYALHVDMAAFGAFGLCAMTAPEGPHLACAGAALAVWAVDLGVLMLRGKHD